MKSTKTLKSFYTMRIVALALFICFFSSCSEEVKETLQEEALVEEPLELSFSKSISLEDEHGNTISFDVSSNVQAELDDYSASSFEFKAMTQEDLLAQEEEVEEALDDDQIEGEDTELSTVDPIVFKETNIQLNQEDGFIAYQLTMIPAVNEGFEDRRGRQSYNMYSSTAIRALVKSRKAAWKKRIYGYWDWTPFNGSPIEIGSSRICCLSARICSKPVTSIGRMHVKVSAQYRDHFSLTWVYL